MEIYHPLAGVLGGEVIYHLGQVGAPDVVETGHPLAKEPVGVVIGHPEVKEHDEVEIGHPW